MSKLFHALYVLYLMESSLICVLREGHSEQGFGAGRGPVVTPTERLSGFGFSGTGRGWPFVYGFVRWVSGEPWPLSISETCARYRNQLVP